MTPAEVQRIVLALAAKHLRGHHCDRCGGEWITTQTTVYIAHKCQAPRQRLSSWGGQEEHSHRERLDWAKSQLGSALEDAVEPDALLRRVEDEDR